MAIVSMDIGVPDGDGGRAQFAHNWGDVQEIRIRVRMRHS